MHIMARDIKPASNPPAPQSSLPGYDGPERRRIAGAVSTGSGDWTQAMLDELDYGILLLSPDRQLMLMNHAARSELDESHPLQVFGRELRAREPQDVTALHDALMAASRRGLRRLLCMGEAEHRVSLAVVPLQEGSMALEQPCMVTLGKRRMCQQLSVQWFARTVGLTSAEARVLERLCLGLSPREVALEFGVGLATVRTQISSMRTKAGADSMRALVQQVAMLPPMVSMLRGGDRAPGASLRQATQATQAPLAWLHGHIQSRAERADSHGAAV
jgi:DNA-binding CsgD family transcriptional regulator